MPSIYAHYKFGKDVMEKLPQEIKEEIYQNTPLYKIGLHGPDILFYFKGLRPNKVNQLGFRMHKESGKKFFKRAKSVWNEREQLVPDLAYLYGFVCHFILDSTSHPYIEKKIKRSGISHTEIEVEFDRMLIEKEGKDPLNYELTKHISSSSYNAEVIAPYFRGITPKQVKKALEDMKFYNHLLKAPNKVKRKCLVYLLKLTKNEKEMKGLIINEKPNPKCEDSCKRLEELYIEGVDKAVRAIIEFHEFILEKGKLDENFELNFSGQRV